MFKLDDRRVPDGTVLTMGIEFEGMGQTGPEKFVGYGPAPKIFTYTLLKAGGLWYVTGGKAPQAAGWGAIVRWLERDNKRVHWVRLANGWTDVFPPRTDEEDQDRKPDREVVEEMIKSGDLRRTYGDE